MTTVRHETVHYTAEEMAIKEAVERAAKLRQQKTKLIVWGVILGLSVLSCFGCFLISALQ